MTRKGPRANTFKPSHMHPHILHSQITQYSWDVWYCRHKSPVVVINPQSHLNIDRVVVYPGWRSLTLVSIFIIMKIPLNNPICVLVHTFSDDGILFFRQAGLDPDVIEAFDMGTSTEMEC